MVGFPGAKCVHQFDVDRAGRVIPTVEDQTSEAYWRTAVFWVVLCIVMQWARNFRLNHRH